jgi:hypothetical protein
MRVFTVGVWNAEWKSPSSPSGRKIKQKLESLNADILCLSEGFKTLLPETGETIESDTDYGYPQKPGRRKVLLWSRQGWSSVDRIGDPSLPSGRFVSGITETPIGLLKVMGVCIPWRDAHVRTGRKDRSPWEDHMRYLCALKGILSRPAGEASIVVGDFNQGIPRTWQPHEVINGLDDTFAGSFEPATAGTVSGIEKQLIDHLAHSRDLLPRVGKWIQSV